jgi:type II secretory pathway pseudopilin PulG
MNANLKNHRSSGFSLVEVVLAIGIVAIAIPSVLGVMAVFSSSSSATMGRGEAASAANSLQLYLSGKVTNLPFATVYGWTYAARQSPANAQVIYAFKTNASQTDYSFSQVAPTGTIEGKLLAAEILAPDTRILPSAALVSNSALYTKAYLPIKVSIYALSASAQPRTPATFVDSYPMVISK